MLAIHVACMYKMHNNNIIIYINDLVLSDYTLSQLDPCFAPHTHLWSIFHYHGAGVIHLIILDMCCVTLPFS